MGICKEFDAQVGTNSTWIPVKINDLLTFSFNGGPYLKVKLGPKGGFGRGFQFFFLGILILGILSSGIVFSGMHILGGLVDRLNFQKNFVHFQKYPWQFGGSRRWLAATGSGPTMV